MKNSLRVALAFIVLLIPGIVQAKGSYMEIRATVESFSVVGDSLEVVFYGTMSHVSGNGTNGDQWGFSARVKKTKLVIPNRKMACFFTQGKEPMTTRNLKDDFEMGSKIYGRKGHQIWIAAYDPVIFFDDDISKITSGSVCFSIMDDTMSNTAIAPKNETEQGGAGQPATASESKPEGKDKPQPDSEPAPR